MQSIEQRSCVAAHCVVAPRPILPPRLALGSSEDLGGDEGGEVGGDEGALFAGAVFEGAAGAGGYWGSTKGEEMRRA